MFLHRVLRVFLAALLSCAAAAAMARASLADVTFDDIAAGLPGAIYGLAAWGDYDNDGDLDILLTGDAASGSISRVYRNDAGVFTDIGSGLQGVSVGSGAWGDYDNDGDLDVLLTGKAGLVDVSHVYRNDAGIFTDADAGLTGVYAGSAAWGDYDNDGDLDILLTGRASTGRISSVYRNDGGVFTDVAAGLTGVDWSSAAWGDYDNDGDLDIALTGISLSGNLSLVYRNDGGVFTDINAGLVGVRFSSVKWGDYDADGQLDILLAGYADSGIFTRVYRNDGGTFTDIGAGLPGVYRCSVDWGDFDNDGDLDVLLAGGGDSSYVSQVYRNDGGTFTDIAAGLPGVWRSSVDWGDYDNDGDLDILLAGEGDSSSVSQIWRSDGAPANTPPTPPGGLSASVVLDQLTLIWGASTDGQTPAAGLSYNLRVGTTPGGSEIVSAMADEATGFRRVVELGNAQQRTSWILTVPVWETYYWSVQSVDGAYAGSAFAPEHSLESPPEAGRIDGVEDIADDQGQWVRVFFTRSGYDFDGSPMPVFTYYVWRRIDDPALLSRIETESVPVKDGDRAAPESVPTSFRGEINGARLVNLDSRIFLLFPAGQKGEFPPGAWEVTASAPALQQDSYIAAAPTLGDSTGTGVVWSVHCVSAHTQDPTVWFASSPDSGYSVDNLEPTAPENLAARRQGVSAVLLNWDKVPDEDFNYYSVYRGTEEGFELGEPVGYSTTQTFTDGDLPGPGLYWYKVTATDFSGNRSVPSAADRVRILRWAERFPFGLGPVSPNPFNLSTEITYGIPSDAGPSRVVLAVYDATGREVTTLVDADQGPGEYRVVWDGRNHNGVEAASGVYFYRISWNGKSQTRRMVLLK